MEDILRDFTKAEWEEIEARIMFGESIDSAMQTVIVRTQRKEH